MRVNPNLLLSAIIKRAPYASTTSFLPLQSIIMYKSFCALGGLAFEDGRGFIIDACALIALSGSTGIQQRGLSALRDALTTHEHPSFPICLLDHVFVPFLQWRRNSSSEGHPGWWYLRDRTPMTPRLNHSVATTDASVESTALQDDLDMMRKCLHELLCRRFHFVGQTILEVRDWCIGDSPIQSRHAPQDNLLTFAGMNALDQAMVHCQLIEYAWIMVDLAAKFSDDRGPPWVSFGVREVTGRWILIDALRANLTASDVEQWLLSVSRLLVKLNGQNLFLVGCDHYGAQCNHSELPGVDCGSCCGRWVHHSYRCNGFVLPERLLLVNPYHVTPLQLHIRPWALIPDAVHLHLCRTVDDNWRRLPPAARPASCVPQSWSDAVAGWVTAQQQRFVWPEGCLQRLVSLHCATVQREWRPTEEHVFPFCALKAHGAADSENGLSLRASAMKVSREWWLQVRQSDGAAQHACSTISFKSFKNARTLSDVNRSFRHVERLIQQECVNTDRLQHLRHLFLKSHACFQSITSSPATSIVCKRRSLAGANLQHIIDGVRCTVLEATPCDVSVPDLIDSDAACDEAMLRIDDWLQGCCSKHRGPLLVGVDSEFDGGALFHQETACVLQISVATLDVICSGGITHSRVNNHHLMVFDCCSVSASRIGAVLRMLFGSPRSIMVVHAGANDIPLLLRHFHLERVPATLDTAIMESMLCATRTSAEERSPAHPSCKSSLAQAFLSSHAEASRRANPGNVGLGTLMERYLGMKNRKNSSVARWHQWATARPIPSASVDYAAKDALVLPHIVVHQLRRIFQVDGHDDCGIVAEVERRCQDIWSQSVTTAAQGAHRSFTAGKEHPLLGCLFPHLNNIEESVLASFLSWRMREAQERGCALHLVMPLGWLAKAREGIPIGRRSTRHACLFLVKAFILRRASRDACSAIEKRAWWLSQHHVRRSIASIA